jgi:hypothetical protein
MLLYVDHLTASTGLELKHQPSFFQPSSPIRGTKATGPKFVLANWSSS